MERCEKEKCCGNCCWFCFETTDGDGQCVEVGNDGYPMSMTYCGSKACEKYVSRQQMRHYMAILLQSERWAEWFEGYRPGPIFLPDAEEYRKARLFSYKYMKIFGKL